MSDNGGDPASGMLVPAIGALIFASGEPVHAKEIVSAFPDVSRVQVDEALQALEQLYSRNEVGLSLEQVAGGYRIVTRADVAPMVRQFFRQRNRARLSPAALETLAVVAYRQPVTVPEIQAIRGKDPTAALKNLVEKKLLKILGRKKVVGNPLLYGTSDEFLVHFGLNRLDDLPTIEQFDELVGTLEFAEDPGEEEELGAESIEDPPPPAGAEPERGAPQ